MSFLAEAIYQLSTAMLTPVLAALLIQFGGTLYSLGAFAREWRTRCDPTGLLVRAAADRPAQETLADFELAASRRLAWMSFGVRIGPLLGLMGTLIPMGPALLGISQGDVHSMAENLVIVFSTTVVGVLIGGLCYGMLLTRRQWYARDLADLERYLDRQPAGPDSPSIAKAAEENHA